MKDQQHGVSAQQSDRRSPLYAAKHDADEITSRAVEPIDQTSMQQHEQSGLNGIVGSDVVSASPNALQPNTAAPEAISSSKYPHTKLYQFADIELAHGH